MTQIQQQQNPQLIKNTTISSTTRQIAMTEIIMTQMITRTNTEHGTLLHVACQGHPPLWIIQTLCAIQPQWISCRKKYFGHKNNIARGGRVRHAPRSGAILDPAPT
jgi:hypothetical protein